MVAISAILLLLVCGGCQALLNQQPTIRVGRSIRPDISRAQSFHWQSAGLLAAIKRSKSSLLWRPLPGMKACLVGLSLTLQLMTLIQKK